MLPPLFKALNMTTAQGPGGWLNGESGIEDCVAVWPCDASLSLVSFATPECIPEIKAIPSNVVVINPQLFLDDWSRDESKDFISKAVTVYTLTQLNLKGDGLGGALPVRGILYRVFPSPFRAARRLDQGGYVLLREYETKPTRAELEELFLNDSTTRDAKLTFVQKLQKLVPRVD
jgi:hypothetical protein